jgi:hypothetical protein
MLAALNIHFRFRHRVTFIVNRSALAELANIYARAEAEGEPEALLPTEDILPGPLSEGAIADIDAGQCGRLGGGRYEPTGKFYCAFVSQLCIVLLK